MRRAALVVCLVFGTVLAAQQPNPRQQPGAVITMFAPEQHDLYDGHYVLSANRIYMVGGAERPGGWDHMDNEAKTVKPVSGTAEIDVNDLTNTGKFEARLKIPEGDLVLAIDKCQRVQPLPERRYRRIPSRARDRFRVRRQQLAEDFRLPGRLGIRARHAERQAALRELRNALYGDAGDSRSEDVARELPDGQQETTGRRSESRHTTDRFLHSQPAAESEEPAKPRGVHAFLWHGGHLEVVEDFRERLGRPFA